jgi:Tfp pilus assembly pilus retraction ATPase PilT
MARLDSLLQELAKHRTATLVLEPGRRPHLSDGGSEREISRTVLQSEQIAALVQETAPDSSPGRFRYTLGGQEFDFEVTQDNGTCRAKISRPRAETVVEPTASADAERLPEIAELLDALITRSGSDLHLSSRQKSE